jgi:hypothetical protein
MFGRHQSMAGSLESSVARSPSTALSWSALNSILATVPAAMEWAALQTAARRQIPRERPIVMMETVSPYEDWCHFRVNLSGHPANVKAKPTIQQPTIQ